MASAVKCFSIRYFSEENNKFYSKYKTASNFSLNWLFKANISLVECVSRCLELVLRIIFKSITLTLRCPRNFPEILPKATMPREYLY